MGLSRSDKENLAILIVGGIVLGASSFGVRVIADHYMMGFPAEFYTTQYSLGFIFLGFLILLLWKAGTKVGKIGTSMLTFAVSIGLAFPPLNLLGIESIIVNLFYIGLVVGGGFLYYRFTDPTNTILIAGVTVLAIEHYLFAVIYSVAAFMQLGRPVFIVAVLFLSLILYGVRNVLGEELKKTQDNSSLAQNLRKVLV